MDMAAGQRFERWTVLTVSGRKVTCQCDCGTTKVVDKYSLLDGRSRSCGCLNSERSAERGHQRLKHPVRAGDRFGRWLVLDASDRRAILCRCDCGTEKTVPTGNLTQGVSNSCGCLRSQMTGQRFRTHGASHKDYLYDLWASVKARCCCVTNKNYPNYGGRGIRMHEPWIEDFARFAADLIAEIGPRPASPFGRQGWLTLDRVNNDGNYEPGNLQWATMTTQARSRRSRWREREGSPS